MTTEQTPGTAFLAAMEAALNPTALFRLNKRNLPQNDTWPRYVVERMTLNGATPEMRTQGNPRSLGLDSHEFAVHCWGEAESDCERMRQAFITAARGYLAGRSYAEPPGTWTEPTWAQTGFVLTMQFTAWLPQIKAVYPSAVPPGIYPPPRETVTNDVQTTTVVETDLVNGTITDP